MARTNEHEQEVEAGIPSTLAAIVETGVAILDAAAEIVMITEIGVETELMLGIRIDLQDGTAETVMIGADATVGTLRTDEDVTAGNGVLETIGTEIRAVIEISPAIPVMIDEAIGIETWAGIVAIGAEPPRHDVISRPPKRRSRKQLSNVSLKPKPTWRLSRKPEKKASRFLDSTSRSRMRSHVQTGVVVTSFRIPASEMQTPQA
jgi:hypothetical protein